MKTRACAAHDGKTWYCTRCFQAGFKSQAAVVGHQSVCSGRKPALPVETPRRVDEIRSDLNSAKQELADAQIAGDRQGEANARYRIQELYEENQRLGQEIRRMREENKNLRDENVGLRAAIGNHDEHERLYREAKEADSSQLKRCLVAGGILLGVLAIPVLYEIFRQPVIPKGTKVVRMSGGGGSRIAGALGGVAGAVRTGLSTLKLVREAIA